MGYERSEPRSKLIAALAIGSAVVLLAVHFALVSLFAKFEGREVRAKVLEYRSPEASAYLEKQSVALEKGKAQPIDTAIRTAAVRGFGPRAVVPFDPSAVEGWSLSADTQGKRCATLLHLDHRLRGLMAGVEAGQAEAAALAPLNQERAELAAEISKAGGCGSVWMEGGLR